MTGQEYENFVKAVLVKRFGIPLNELRSVHEPGATLPGGPALIHQIDLYHVAHTPIADYITIIECKHRSTAKVDQEEVLKVARVKSSIRASKAIMVSNRPFTKGALAAATSERIALLVLSPDEALTTTITSVEGGDIVATLLRALEQRPESYKMTVVCKFAPDPNERGLDLVTQLLDDPKARRVIIEAARDPRIREAAEDFLRRNPDIARKAGDFLKGW